MNNVFRLPSRAPIAAFLYYAVLTLAVIGGADFSAAVMAALYGLPPTALAALWLGRALGHLATLAHRLPTPLATH